MRILSPQSGEDMKKISEKNLCVSSQFGDSDQVIMKMTKNTVKKGISMLNETLVLLIFIVLIY
jgi:hypothetical protein